MDVDLFDFDLPEGRIALRPVIPRDGARLLVVRGRTVEDKAVRDLPGLLCPGDLMVFNDTRVISAGLTGRRAPRAKAPAGGRPEFPGPRIEATLHKRAGPNLWWAFLRPLKKLEEGDRITFAGELAAEVKTKGQGGEALLAFEEEGAALDDAVARAGAMPLPPYIARRRAPDARDEADYQTVYAVEPGAVAAPTAGLHFTEHLLDALDASGVGRAMVTLHVGAGTFLPVKAAHTEDHIMHAERGVVSQAAAASVNEARARGGRIVAVGTTALRLLEAAADEDGTVAAFDCETRLFITPGYRFKVVDVLMTNFHLPRSTLFMLVSAFCGLDVMKQAYAHAVDAGYRFYSYGDATLLFPETA